MRPGGELGICAVTADSCYRSDCRTDSGKGIKSYCETADLSNAQTATSREGFILGCCCHLTVRLSWGQSRHVRQHCFTMAVCRRHRLMHDTACARSTAQSTSLYAHARRRDGLGLAGASARTEPGLVSRICLLTQHLHQCRGDFGSGASFVNRSITLRNSCVTREAYTARGSRERARM